MALFFWCNLIDAIAICLLLNWYVYKKGGVYKANNYLFIYFVNMGVVYYIMFSYKVWYPYFVDTEIGIICMVYG